MIKSFLLFIFTVSLISPQIYASAETDGNIECTELQAQNSCEHITNINDCVRRHSPQINVDEDKGLAAKVASWLGVGYAGVNCGECGTFLSQCVTNTEELDRFFPDRESTSEN